MIITILYSDNNPSDYHRLLLPAKYIDDPNITIRLVRHTDCSKDESIFQCDILLFSRLFIHDWSTMEQLKKKYGFKIIVDFDDYYKLSPNQLRYKIWKDHDVANRMVQAAVGSDLIFVTNKQLYNVYKEFNSNIVIVANALPFNTIKFPPASQPDKVRFLYVAGKTHYNDLKLLHGLFHRLRSDSDFKRKASFTFCGYDSTPDKDRISARMEAICKIYGSYVRREILPLDNYFEHYCYGDVSIAPLQDNFYNNCKSNLKFIEAACMKLPFICSDVSPYDKEVMAPGIIWCKNTADWYKAFKFFINNPRAVEDFGNANYKYAKERYNLDTVNVLRKDAFEFLTI